MSINNDKPVLSQIFKDPRFRQLSGSRHLWFGEVDGMKIGVILATIRPPYTSFALNEDEMERLLAGKQAGKIDRAAVVAARNDITNSGGWEYLGHADAEKVREKLRGVRPRSSDYGNFWVLPSGIIEVEDEPF
jgi:hypothetical protein